MNVKEIKEICNELNIIPTKKLGQNFLINEDVVEKILQAGELSKDDVVLEIGPGLGVLTWKLVERAETLIAVEADRKIAEYLKSIKTIKSIKNLEIINEDVLKVKSEKLKVKSYKLISNLPYQITSPVLWKFLHEEKNKPSLMVLMVQKEVGERILAKSGKMNLLAVLCQFYAEIKKVCDVSRENFWPSPEVDSMVIRLTTKRQNNKTTKEFEKMFFQMVKIGFSQKRKMLKNNLANGLKIEQEKIILALKNCGLNEKVRAQELSVEEWIKITKQLTTKQLTTRQLTTRQQNN